MSWNIQDPGKYINGPLTVIGTMIRGAVAADTTTTDAATMVNIGNFAVQFAPSNGTLFAIKPGAANGTVDFRIDARSGNYPDLRFLLGNSERVRFDYLGNVGLSVAPSAWSQGKAIEIGSLGNSIWGAAPNQTIITANSFYNGGWKYAANGTATNYEQASGQHFWYSAPSNSSGAGATCTFGAAKMTLNANGVLALLNGNASANGVGIAFGATQSASTDANTLDDYEEGTWTGTLQGSSTNPTTPVTATGKYTKIGRQVTIQISFDTVNTTGASGGVRVSGLPFASADTSFGVLQADMGIAFTGTLGAYIGSGGTVIFASASASSGARNDGTHNAGTARFFWINMTYNV